MHRSPFALWWGAARAAWRFPAGGREAAWRAALNAGRGDRDREFTGAFGELIGERRCAVCCADDIAHDGWVAVEDGLVCAECSQIVLDGGLAFRRSFATFRGRPGSPRRAFGEAYQAVVAFKERRGDWAAFAAPLARALARSVICGVDAAAALRGRERPLVLPVPSYRGRRPHVQLLLALAAPRLPQTAIKFGVLQKRLDFRQKGLTRAERFEESAGAYRVQSRSRRTVRGRYVIVADDLLTTGSTLDACAHALREAGAAAVDGAAIVRVVRAPPEPMLALGTRQVRVQLRELDGRWRTPVSPESGLLWVQFGCSTHCPVTALAGPYPIPSLDAAAYHSWQCRCGAKHAVGIRREWRGSARQCVAVGVGDRAPQELLVGIVQGRRAQAAL